MKIAGKLLWVQGIPFYFQNGTLIGWVPFGKNYIGVGLFCYSNSCGWSAGAGAGGTPVERVPYSKIVYNIHYTIVHLVETKRVSLAIRLQAARLIPNTGLMCYGLQTIGRSIKMSERVHCSVRAVLSITCGQSVK